MQESRRSEALLYAIHISNYFQAKCGRQLSLTLDEWSCIQHWREQGLDVECVLRGIDLAFSMGADQVLSLLHCTAAVQEVSKVPS
jgi:hypothetical protein